MSLAERIERLFNQQSTTYGLEYFQAFDELKHGLNTVKIRAAEPDPASPSGWKVNAWVKMGILLGFRIGVVQDMTGGGPLHFYDKTTYPLRKIGIETGVRVVPGGSSI